MHARARRLVEQDGLSKTLGIRVLELDPERVAATMPVAAHNHQPWGYLGGGANLALAEIVASLGGTLNCPEGKAAFGMEVNANHVRSVREGWVLARAVPLHRGRTSQVWEVKIDDERDSLVCAARCTLAVVSVGSEALNEPA
jgi:uncharacterized protein (TIGR00369 family)